MLNYLKTVHVRFAPNFAEGFILTLSRNHDTQELHLHFSKSNMAADENTNSIKELNDVKKVRPISTKIGMKYPVATIYTLDASSVNFTTQN